MVSFHKQWALMGQKPGVMFHITLNTVVLGLGVSGGVIVLGL